MQHAARHASRVPCSACLHASHAMFMSSFDSEDFPCAVGYFGNSAANVEILVCRGVFLSWVSMLAPPLAMPPHSRQWVETWRPSGYHGLPWPDSPHYTHRDHWKAQNGSCCELSFVIVCFEWVSLGPGHSAFPNNSATKWFRRQMIPPPKVFYFNCSHYRL